MSLLLLRADASARIGSGHVMRCLALAEAWRGAGGRALFACREHAGHLCETIVGAGFEVVRLPMGRQADASGPGLAHAHWLGAGWREDAEALLALIDALPEPPAWLGVDHYALDRRWETVLRERVGGLLVIDDLADRDHAPCLLLDQNLVADLHGRYADRVAEPSRLLLGPRYALLRGEFAELHARTRPRARPVRRVLLHFGAGADPHDIAGRSLRALQSLRLPELEADLVVGTARAPVLRARFAADPTIRVHAALPSLAGLMAEADFAIGACGVSAWERLCLGLPAVVVTMAANQHAGARELDRQGLAPWLGDHDSIGDAALASGIAAAIARLPDPEWSARCLAQVDGGGAARVLAAMAQGAPPLLRARLAIASDERRLLDWANDPLTRANAFATAPIALADHQRWFRSRLADPDCRLFVLATGSADPVGTVRFQREIEGWEVHFNLAPEARGRGLGRGLVATAIEALRAAEGATALVFGRVKAGNAASRRIFEALGFEEMAVPGAGVLAYRRSY